LRKDGWISVDDRLPSNQHEDVFIHPYVGDDNCVLSAHLDLDNTWRYYEPKRNNSLPCFPTHWQPLPSPPAIKSEQKESEK